MPTSRRWRPGMPPTSRPRPKSSPASCCRPIPTTCAPSPIASTARAPAPSRATGLRMASMVEAAERGLAVLPKWRKPAGHGRCFVRTRQQLGAVFNGALGDAALQAKDYDKARRHYREAVAAEPDNLQDVYQLTVSLLEGTPLDALGFWYAARSIAIARAAKSDAAAARYRPLRALALPDLSRQRGGLERTARARRRGRARAAGGFRQVDPARADAARGRPPGHRGPRSRLALVRRLGARAAPSRCHAGQQDRGGESLESDRRQAAGRRHAAQDPGQGDRRDPRHHRGRDHR